MPLVDLPLDAVDHGPRRHTEVVSQPDDPLAQRILDQYYRLHAYVTVYVAKSFITRCPMVAAGFVGLITRRAAPAFNSFAFASTVWAADAVKGKTAA